MAALDSLIPTFDDEVAGHLVTAAHSPAHNNVYEYTVNRLVDYSDDDMPGLEGVAASQPMPPLESDGEENYGADVDESPVEAEAEAEEADTSSDVEPTIEEHLLEKNPLEMYSGVNVCISMVIFCVGMITAFALASAPV